MDLPEPILHQAGVVSRQQLLASGLSASDIRRLVRRRQLARVHPGVYIDHTGPLTWHQRAWAAVLVCAPAALYGQSALRAVQGREIRGFDESGPVHVAVGRQRNLSVPDGVRLHRVVGLDERVQWNASPPRMRVEEAVIDLVAGAATDFDAVAALAGAVQSRLTTAHRLLVATRNRARLRRRVFVLAVLEDIDAGCCSALEHAYLDRVERRHGLPAAHRQVRASSRGSIFRDVEYADHGIVVELDGRLDHTAPRDRDRDLARDLDAAVDGLVTVRLSWGQAVRTPCHTAERVHRLLDRRAATPALNRCPEC